MNLKLVADVNYRLESAPAVGEVLSCAGASIDRLIIFDKSETDALTPLNGDLICFADLGMIILKTFIQECLLSGTTAANANLPSVNHGAFASRVKKVDRIVPNISIQVDTAVVADR